MTRRPPDTRVPPQLPVILLLFCATLIVVARPDVSMSVQSGPGGSRPAAKHHRVLRGTGIFRLGNSYQTASSYERFQYVVVSRHVARDASRLPGTALVYTSGTAVQEAWSTGVPFSTAAARDNGWLLKGADGEFIRGPDGSFVADLGNEDYQRAFAKKVSTLVRTSRSDGVFIDNVVADVRTETGGVVPPGYPTQRGWEAATLDFVGYVGRALKKRGYYVLVNAVKFVPQDARSDNGRLTRQFWSRLAPSVSGVLMEFWLQNPMDLKTRELGTHWFQQWSGWQALVATAQRHGADFFGLMYGDHKNRRPMRFGRGSFMLDWNGKGGAFVFHMTDGSDHFDTAWVRQLGSPVAPKVRRARGVWQRRYERGVVVVNARSEAVTLRVDGAATTVGAADAAFISRTGRRFR
jgi:Hypothetical glycosyl hydrolase family 15